MAHLTEAELRRLADPATPVIDRLDILGRLAIDDVQRTDGPVAIGDLTPAFLADLRRSYERARAGIEPERWPVVRTGEREQIPSVVRGLVYERDGKCCRMCGRHLAMQDVELDHIVPWSAGGSDRSDNLRVTCKPCNSERSNFRGFFEYDRRQAVCRSCVDCSRRRYGEEPGDPYDAFGDGPGETVLAFCGRCGVVSRAWPEAVL